MSKNFPCVNACKPYRKIGYYLLKEDTLEKGDLASYFKDFLTQAYVVPRVGTTPSSLVEMDQVFVPTVTLSAKPFNFKKQHAFAD